ncbi:hypothetical protein [Hymenobacter tenuis]
MAWTVGLLDENHCEQALLGRELTVEIDLQQNDFLVLRYLNPYGDTVFNCLQMEDLIKDILRQKNLTQDALLDDIIALADRCKQEVHLYVVFYGD